MGIDKTQSAIEIMKYFYQNRDREYGVTVSELRKKVLPRAKKGESDVWLKSSLGSELVKDVVSIMLHLKHITKGKDVHIKDKVFKSYKITKKGEIFVEQIISSDQMKEFFAAILYKELMRP